MRAILAIGIVMIAGHNLLDGVRRANPRWSILHSPGLVLQGEHTVFTAYPLVPWIGVTAVGYALGALFEWPDEGRRRTLLQVGVASIVLFAVRRAWNLYGNPAPPGRRRWRSSDVAKRTVSRWRRAPLVVVVLSHTPWHRAIAVRK